MMPSPRRIVLADGKPAIEFAAECAADVFPRLAEEIFARLGMTVTRRIKGMAGGGDVLMWIATLGEQQWCISWDVWACDVTIMPWGDTAASAPALDGAIDQLLRRWND